MGTTGNSIVLIYLIYKKPKKPEKMKLLKTTETYTYRAEKLIDVSAVI